MNNELFSEIDSKKERRERKKKKDKKRSKKEKGKKERLSEGNTGDGRMNGLID